MTTKYYIDTEFLEGTQNKYFLGIPYGKTEKTIDLISIGIVSEDNRKFYAISNEFNLKEAWNRYDLKETEYTKGFGYETEKEVEKVYWIRENVLKPIWEDYLKNQNTFEKTHFWHLTSEFSYKTMKHIIRWTGKSNKQIAEEIKEFVGYPNYDYQPKTSIGRCIEKSYPEFYVYFGDYDWVVFCWLFGKMINLPSGFSYYAKDLKQIMDEKFKGLNEYQIMDIKDGKVMTKDGKIYPKQTNEHSAIHDAIWNKQLHEFLNNLK